MFILDTNVVSELRKKSRANRDVAEWALRRPAQQLFMSVVTVRELECGVLQSARKDPRQAASLGIWLEAVLHRFEGRILDIDMAIARRCATLHVPDPKPERDAWIAATALVHGMILVTRNTKDFVSTGTKLFDPWTAPS
jgi:predicted nucleic acid-binding protein